MASKVFLGLARALGAPWDLGDLGLGNSPKFEELRVVSVGNKLETPSDPEKRRRSPSDAETCLACDKLDFQVWPLQKSPPPLWRGTEGNQLRRNDAE